MQVIKIFMHLRISELIFICPELFLSWVPLKVFICLVGSSSDHRSSGGNGNACGINPCWCWGGIQHDATAGARRAISGVPVYGCSRTCAYPSHLPHLEECYWCILWRRPEVPYLYALLTCVIICMFLMWKLVVPLIDFTKHCTKFPC